MAITGIVLFVVARVWIHFDQVTLLPVRFDWPGLIIGVGLGGAIALASAGIYQLWPSYRHAADQYLSLVLTPLLWADIVWLGLLPGLSEELLFRGVMLSALGLNIIALVLSSLCFGVLHMGSLQQWPYVIWASSVGGVLGWTALTSENLFIPVVAHIVTNWIAGISWKLLHPKREPIQDKPNP